VQAGWWDALAPLMAQKVDYIGRPSWRDYQSGSVERLQTHAWYMGVPPARREGRVGISYVSSRFMVVRARCLQEAHELDPECAASEAMLGEMAHQLGWTHVVHDRHVLF
jgi:hypothetical protein